MRKLSAPKPAGERAGAPARINRRQEKTMLDLTEAFATFPVLETKRFTLRAVEPEDAPEIFRIMGDPRVTRYFGQLPMAALGEAAQRVERIRAAFRDQATVVALPVSHEMRHDAAQRTA